MSWMAIAAHVWQSTLFAGAAWLLTLALRPNRAAVRHAVWLAASLKFLVPLALLVALGSQAGWQRPNARIDAQLTAIIEAVGQPFAPARGAATPPTAVSALTAAASLPTAALPLVAGLWLLGCAAVALTWFVRWRRVAVEVRRATALTEGREYAALTRAARHAPVPRLVTTDTAIEPGVFGVSDPVILWPRAMSSHLTDEQIESIFAHEMAHIARRDNAAAVVHMTVQALFWFHPAVWWIGRRLIDERERACDQAVIDAGRAPEVYVESILRTCRFSLESPIACMSGVTGSDLQRRVVEIMRPKRIDAVRGWRAALLMTVGLGVIAGPIAFGSLRARPASAQDAVPGPSEPAAFDAATIKPNTSGAGFVSMRFLPGGAYQATNVTLRSMIQQAYRMAEFQVIGGPDWLQAERYDILAKSPDGATQAGFMNRLQALLNERLALRTHRETREAAVYTLVLARDDRRLGPQLKASSVDCRPAAAARGREGQPPVSPVGRQMMPPAMPALGEARPCSMMRNGGRLSGGGQTMAALASTLQTNTGRIVLDQTGLSGAFDFDLEFTPDPGLTGAGPGGGLPGAADNPRPVNSDALSIFTAVQEQLGLKLESTRAPVEVLVIDAAQRPQD